jgi:DNA repair exonuclease SbcCD ATPase subunit
MGMIDEVRRPIPIMLGIVAIVGWVYVLILLSDRTDLRTDLADQTQAVGTVEDLQREATALTLETDALKTQRDEVSTEITAQQSSLSNLQNEVATAQSSLDQITSEQSAIADQITPMREEIAGFETARAEAENNLTAATQELADIGNRLTEARASQAQLQEQLSVLTADTSRLAQEASDAEARVQQAREAEATSQTAIATATQQLEALTAERDTVSKALEDMTQRRDQLMADTLAAEEQQQSVQAIINQLSDDLATRSQYLSDIEQRIADLQDQSTQDDQETQVQESSNQDAEAQPNEQAATTLAPGSYSSGAISMILAENGGFTLSHAERDEEVAGRYEASEGQLTLSDAKGDVGTTIFPMTCGVQRAEAGFTIAQVGEQVCPLAGLTWQAQ